jgi:ABC-type nitrate/sulfonate/bicarbonate transport system ATPase subunit
MIMLDEPSAALAPQIVMDIFRTSHRITRDGMTVLMVEQNVRMALLLDLRLCHQGRRHPHRGDRRQDDLRRQRAPSPIWAARSRTAKRSCARTGRLMWIFHRPRIIGLSVGWSMRWSRSASR